jgi:hypothetical protein
MGHEKPSRPPNAVEVEAVDAFVRIEFAWKRPPRAAFFNEAA